MKGPNVGEVSEEAADVANGEELGPVDGSGEDLTLDDEEDVIIHRRRSKQEAVETVKHATMSLIG